MKRLIIVVCMVILILGVGFLSLFQLNRITSRLETELDGLAELVESQSGAELRARTESFQSLWENEEKVMMRYIHHDELDTITGTVARLGALARYEDYPELAAEIDRLRHLVRHIYESETPSLHSIF